MSCTAFYFGNNMAASSKQQPSRPAREDCPKLALPTDLDLEVADLCMGWFWTPDYFFSSLEGVKEVTVGYAGGKQANPTYKHIKDHTEAVRIVYDPNLLSFEELLEYFVQELGSPPFLPSFSKQYRPAILFHTAEQQKEAKEMLGDWEKKHKNKKIFVDIEPATDFYMAEEYHQKYFQKQRERG